MALTSKQKFELKKLVKELSRYRGRHTELVSVYVPKGYDMNKIINHLSQEQSTAENIKSKSTRKNVIDALEKMIQHLKVYKKTPENGLAVFSGNVAEREGQSDVQVWSVEPPVHLNQRLYRCDKEFVLEPLDMMLEHKNVYGLVVMDRRDANIALLKGKTIVPLTKTHSQVPGKFRAGGQCISPDSLVQLSDGSIPKIKTVHNPNIVKSVMIKDSFTINDSNITDKWNAKKKQIYKIITKNPRLEVQSSKDHIFFVAASNGLIEKPAEELKKGDHLIMPEKINIKGKTHRLNSKKYYNSFIISKKGQKLLKQKRQKKKLFQRQLAKKINVAQTTISSYELGKLNAKREQLKKICNALDINFKDFIKNNTRPFLYKKIKLPIKLNEKFAQFLGYLIGDGCIEKDRITFFEQYRDLALSYQKKFSKLFEMDLSYRFRKNKNYHQIRFTSRPLVRLIQNEFPEIKKSLDSEIPQKILQSNNEIIASFLKGIFDAEGYVSTRKQVALGINNKRLVQQLQLALLRFSIIGSMHEYDNKVNIHSNNPRFTLDITEKKSLKLFKKFIGFTSKKKSEKLKSIIKNKSGKSNIRQIVVSGRKIKKIIENAGYNLQLFPKVNCFFRNERMMGKQTFKNSILSNIKDEKLFKQLEEIYHYSILPVKIHEIEKRKKPTKMVDISVKNQNFIANGLIVHNSAQRFARIREGAAKRHYKKVADYVKNEFLKNKNLKGIIVGGPGPTKEDFVEGGYLTGDLKKKVIAVKDLSYTGDFGLQELVDKSQDVLAKEEIAFEKKLMGNFFEILSKNPGKVSYGEKEVMKNLKLGAVDILLLSEVLEDEKVEEFENESEKVGTNVEIISTETREGAQLKDIGKIAAILRYEVQQ